MDLYNPYDKPEVSQAFPWGLAVAFGIGLVVLGVATWLLWIRGKESKMRAKVPDWAFNVAYPAFFLLLPFVMLLSTMMFFPCWWKDCPDEPAPIEQQAPPSPEERSNW